MATCKGELIEEYVNRFCPSNRAISLKLILSTRSGEGFPEERADHGAATKSALHTLSSSDSESSDSSFRSLSYETTTDYVTCEESSSGSDKEHVGKSSVNNGKKNITGAKSRGETVPPSQQFKGTALFPLTRQFVDYFMRPHFERKRISGIYVCTVCQAAYSTLQELRSLIRNEARGRQAALYNTTFMSVLLKLCTLNSVEPPRICTVNAEELERFYAADAQRSLEGVARVVKDQEESAKYWEQFLGKAAKSIRTLTYTVSAYNRKRRKSFAGGSSCFWPDVSPTTSKDELLMEEKKRVENDRASVCESSAMIVIGCADARHLWVYCGKAAKEDARSLSCTLHHFLLPSKGIEFAPAVGDMVAFRFEDEQLVRGLVLAITNDMADIWALDAGRYVKMPWKSLIDLPPSFKYLPPLVSLCVVTNVRGAPYLSLLQECMRTLKCIMWHNHTERAFSSFLCKKLTQLNGFEVLSNLLGCPDQDTRHHALLCLLQLTRRHPGRMEASKVGCATKVIEQLKRLLKRCSPGVDYRVVIQEKQYLVNLLQGLFYRNEDLVANLGDSDALQVLCKVQKMSSPNTSLYRDVDRCLRTFLGPLYVDCRLGTQPMLVSMTPEKLKMEQPNLRYGLKSLPQPISRDKGLGKSTAGAGPRQSPTVRFYFRNSLVDFGSDQSHELRPVLNMKLASARTLSKIMCSFLNTWSPCTIYYGITRDRFVRGVTLTYAERDALRRGIDFMAGNIRPHLTSTSFSVGFVPVVMSPADATKVSDRKQVVIEISVQGVINTVYTMSEGACFLRSESLTYQATANEVRQWIARREEQRFLKNEA